MRTAETVRTRGVVLDFAILAVFCALAGALFFQGGLEALIGAGIGAIAGVRGAHWRNARISGALSGAFTGLFAGAVFFAGFFHGGVAALLSAPL